MIGLILIKKSVYLTLNSFLYRKMYSSDSSEDENFDPDQILARNFESEKQKIVDNLLPRKSRAQYAYATFLK